MVIKYSSRVFYAGALREKLCCHSFCQAPRNMSCEAVNEMGPEMSSTHVSGKQCMKVDDECRRIVIELRLYSRPMPQSINWCSSRLRSLKWRHWTLVKRENQRENEIKINCILKKVQFGTCAKNYVRHICACWMVESGCKLFFPCICNATLHLQDYRIKCKRRMALICMWKCLETFVYTFLTQKNIQIKLLL